MTGLVALWLPIVLSAVFVFIASSIIHMAPLWHKKDYPAVPNEEGLRAAVGPLAIPPGDYMVPRASSHADMKNPEFRKKLDEGPVLILTVLRNGWGGMAEPLILWFLYCLVVSAFTAYLTGSALPPGSPCQAVCCFAGCTAFAGYVLALWQMSIWYKRAWAHTIKATLDGLIYALITAATFGWLWPR
jgi:hypothetical protein